MSEPTPTEIEQALAAAADAGDLAPVRALLERWPTHSALLVQLGLASEELVDRRYLNAAPPTDPFFRELVTRLVAGMDRVTDDEERFNLARGLATAARICGRGTDAEAERAHRVVVVMRPDWWPGHYNRGLFFKNRGRFAEGLAANKRAMELCEEDSDGLIWNLGICATGCGDGATALAMWQKIGAKLELQDNGLPEGTWPAVQVRLAERPVAVRSPDHDDPGIEETIWVERLSPCHGRVRSALVQDLGVDYGDIVLFDGAPILTRTWGEREVPVFPHLATLRPGGWQIHPFAGTQTEKGQLAGLHTELPGEAEIYVHTEQFRLLCRTCWEASDQDHQHQADSRRVVTGKLCVPPDLALTEVAAALDGASSKAGVAVYSPTLREALGEPDRHRVDGRRYAMLLQAGQAPE